MSYTSEHTTSKASTVGVLFIFFGAIFLLNNFDVIPYQLSDFLFNWKGFLVLLGTAFLFNSEKRVTGVILISIGSFFLFNNYLSYHFGWFWFESRKFIGPAVLIVIGLLIISKRGSHQRRSDSHSRPFHRAFNQDHLDSNNILGRSDLSVKSKNFQGGKASTLMGNSTFDFSNAELAEGRNEIDIAVIMGDAKFIVPSEWNVSIEITPVFGTFKDKRTLNSTTEVVTDRTLVIKGTVLFGSGEIRNFT